MAPRKRRKRGYIYELPSGSFRVTVSAGTDPLSGRTRQLRETFGSFDEAEKALTRLQRQVDEDQHPKSEITVRRAIEQWLEVVKLEDTTRERYDDLIRLYVLPTFGELQAGRLDAELLERYYARLHRCRTLSCNGNARNGHVCRPLSTSTTRKVHYISAGRWTARCGGDTSGSITRPWPRRPRQLTVSPTRPARTRRRGSSTPHGSIRSGACCSG